MRGVVQVEIVGDEALAAAGEFLLLDDGMSALNDFDGARVGAELWAAIIPESGNVCERAEHIDFGES